MSSLDKNRLDFETAGRLGDVNGITPITLIGHSDAVGTNLRFLHHETNTAALDVDGLYDTPATVKVSSSSALDVLTSGSGAWTVAITGVDSAGAEATESVNLTGQTAVTTTTVWKCIHGIQVTAAGTGLANAGVIWVGSGTVSSGVPATKYCSCEIGTNASKLLLYCVPTGKRLVLHQILCFSGDTTKLLNFQFLQKSAATGLWYEAFDVHTKAGVIDFAVESYPALAAGDIVAVKADVDTGTAIITIAVSGDLVDL